MLYVMYEYEYWYDVVLCMYVVVISLELSKIVYNNTSDSDLKPDYDYDIHDYRDT